MTITIDGTTGIASVDGSAGSPSVRGSDANSGIVYSADNVAFSTAGTSRANIDSSGDLNVEAGNLNVSKPAIPTVLVQNSTDTSYSTVKLQQSSGSGGYFAITKLGTNSSATGGANAAQLWQSGTAPIIFGTDGAERMRITSTGKFLHGRTSSITIADDPSSANFEQLTDNGMALALHCNQSNQRGFGIFYTASKNPSDFIRCHVDSSAKFIVIGSGNCQNSNNSYGSISDASLKENIVDAKSQWTDIKNIKIRNFNFKASSGQETHTQIGVVAQELETVCPKLVDSSGKDGIKTVASSVLYMKAVKALQEAMAKIETLETKVAALEAA